MAQLVKGHVGRPARTSSGAKDRFLRFDGLISVPFAVQNTKPLSSKRSPSPSISSKLACQVLSESFGGVPGELDRPPALSGFGGAYEELSTVLRDCPTYCERLLFYVHVFPTQRQKFALPEAGMQGHYLEGFQAVASDDLQEPTRFVAGERVDFFSVNSWRIHVVGRVLRHVSPPHGLL